MMRDVEHAWHGAGHLSNVDSPSPVFSLVLSTDCFGGGISPSWIEYKIRTLQVSNRQPSQSLCCASSYKATSHCHALIAGKCFCHLSVWKRE